MRMTEDGPLQPTPLWQRTDLEGPAVVREFLRESRIVRKGLDGSLAKARNLLPYWQWPKLLPSACHPITVCAMLYEADFVINCLHNTASRTPATVL